jgi:NADPH:quinone reductase-like Zn-dependent oxidoreductase
MRETMPLSLPSGTGRDAAGIVDEVGEGVSDVGVGDAVFGSGEHQGAVFVLTLPRDR